MCMRSITSLFNCQNPQRDSHRSISELSGFPFSNDSEIYNDARNHMVDQNGSKGSFFSNFEEKRSDRYQQGFGEEEENMGVSPLGQKLRFNSSQHVEVLRQLGPNTDRSTAYKGMRNMLPEVVSPILHPRKNLKSRDLNKETPPSKQFTKNQIQHLQAKTTPGNILHKSYKFGMNESELSKGSFKGNTSEVNSIQMVKPGPAGANPQVYHSASDYQVQERPPFSAESNQRKALHSNRRINQPGSLPPNYSDGQKIRSPFDSNPYSAENAAAAPPPLEAPRAHNFKKKKNNGGFSLAKEKMGGGSKRHNPLMGNNAMKSKTALVSSNYSNLSKQSHPHAQNPF